MNKCAFFSLLYFNYHYSVDFLAKNKNKKGEKLGGQHKHILERKM